jgi:hypothetical protein
MSAFQVRFGELIRVYGHPSKKEDYTFCPVDLEMNDEPETLEDYGFYLADYAESCSSIALRNAIRGRYDVSWTFARIMRVFSIEPEPDEDGIGMVLNQVFLAIPHGHAIGYPFRCCDLAGRSHLQFSIDEPETENCHKIGGAFWRLLLDAPDDRQDFDRRVNGPEHEWALADPTDLDYGCKFGHLYRERSRE